MRTGYVITSVSVDEKWAMDRVADSAGPTDAGGPRQRRIDCPTLDFVKHDSDRYVQLTKT